MYRRYAHDYIIPWSDKTFPAYGNHTNRDGIVYIDKHTQPDDGPVRRKERKNER